MKQHATTDVLVIGGGLAAISAALAATEAGASVTIVNKGVTGQAGSSAKAAGILAAPFGHGGLNGVPIDDSPAQHAADSLSVGYHLGAPDLVRVMAEQACAAVNWLVDHNVEFSRAPTGAFIQLNAPGNSRPRACSAIGGGAAIMTALIAAARQKPITFLDNVSAYRLLMDSGRVSGAALCDSDGRCQQIGAKAVILCAGGASGLFPTVSGDPDNVGNGLVLGLEAGAALANLEFVEYTLIYRVNNELLRIAGMAPFLSRGGKLLNASGDDLLAKYFDGTPSEQIGRAEILRQVQAEIIGGHGPIWLDCTGFSDAVWDEFEASQGAIILSKITAAGGNYRTEKIEVVPAAHSVLAGLVIDINAATSVPGLFAAGENITGIHGAGRLSGNGLTACVVMGRIAGKNAAHAAAQEAARSSFIAPPAPLPQPAPARLSQTQRFDLIADMRHAAGNGLGIIRNQPGIAAAHKIFTDIRRHLPSKDQLHPADTDIMQMAILGALMCDAAERRPESRGVQWRDDAAVLNSNWNKWQIVSMAPDGVYSWTERQI